MERKRGCVVEEAAVMEGATNAAGDERLLWSSWFAVCRFSMHSCDNGDGVGEEDRITVSGSISSTGLKHRRRRLRAGDVEECSAVDEGFF